MKLSTKIQLFSSLFMLILILIINASIYFLFYKNSVDSELQELNEQVNTIMRDMKENPDILPSELLKAFIPVDGMIRVFPKTGDPKYYSRTTDYLGLPGKYSTSEVRQTITFNGAEFVMVSKPIIWNNGDVVTLQFAKELVTVTKNMKSLFYVLVVATIIVLIPTIIAGNLLARFLLQPIKSLIKTMRENMRYGKWNKINVENRSKDELYEMEKTFNEMIDYLKENYEMQEIFVSDASHELKTPISIIKSYAQLLERRGTGNPEIVKESIDAIESEADRMQKLVEQMLALAKNKDITSAERVNMNDLLKQTIDIFNGAYQREIQFEQPNALLHVNGNYDQLKQVFYILIDNALKYSEDKVDVSIEEHENDFTISVKDYGPGIPEDQKERVFERFYRMDKARSRNTGGTGLGLAIAKNIITAHGGTITVESKIGEGSIFAVSLPLT